ncbi:hypothetical protein NCU07802 [Neurospora crassa OR74A]|uniref:Uncharacterized protein n=1 Tax=Neurospora crassa (strain ATCC 24698 / 74-OR23-1A / CBS 708.71 / DSM 1257 / FGSC 987) TaxID=367110 RepID=Q7S1C6_NEUCR|nr:hypothetical protein NCU07802 [Neurospora crassa OR74A]EAA29152.1 hypothetical protein NCU07802 [Neurospora crassa OR74A]|eukprot:XP_958388.1 hypothetical protein NCU07802 [Neurospora crassa OR74A]
MSDPLRRPGPSHTSQRIQHEAAPQAYQTDSRSHSSGYTKTAEQHARDDMDDQLIRKNAAKVQLLLLLGALFITIFVVIFILWAGASILNYGLGVIIPVLEPAAHMKVFRWLHSLLGVVASVLSKPVMWTGCMAGCALVLNNPIAAQVLASCQSFVFSTVGIFSHPLQKFQSHETALHYKSIFNISSEPVPNPEAHEPNTKKKLQSAIQYAMDRKSEGLAGLIMFLPGNVKGLPERYASYDHPVVILSPTISASNEVEILGMTSFRGRDITQRFDTSPEGMKNRAKYLPIEPTPPHPDTPEKNVMLKILPYNPKTYSYVDGSVESRRSVPFSVLTKYLPNARDRIYVVQCPIFYLDKDSYQKLAAFVGFSTVALCHVPVDPEVEREHLTEQLAVNDEPRSPCMLLPFHNGDIPMPAKNQHTQSKHATTQTSEAIEPPFPTHSHIQPISPTSSHSLNAEQVSFIAEQLKRQWAFDDGARHVYGLGGPLNLSKIARNSIRLAIACVAMLTAGGAFRVRTVGREVVEELKAGVQAVMFVAAWKNLQIVAAAKGALTKMAWAVARAVVRHFGRNWGHYGIASLSACVLHRYYERYPGGRGSKWDQILMLAWDVACLRIIE